MSHTKTDCRLQFANSYSGQAQIPAFSIKLFMWDSLIFYPAEHLALSKYQEIFVDWLSAIV